MTEKKYIVYFGQKPYLKSTGKAVSWQGAYRTKTKAEAKKKLAWMKKIDSKAGRLKKTSYKIERDDQPSKEYMRWLGRYRKPKKRKKR